MKFKADENIPVEVVGDLRSEGHSAETVQEEGLAGASDTVILDNVREEHCVFLTMDKGVADVRTYPPEQYAGIVLFRPDRAGRGAVLMFIRQNLPALFSAELGGHLFVVTPRGIRVR